MSLWSRLTAAIGRLAAGVRKMSPDEWLSEFGVSGRSSTGLAVNQATTLQVMTALSCVAILSEDVAKLPVHLYRRLKNGGREIVTGDPVERLLQRPNAWQTRFEFIEMMMGALTLRSNAYAVVLRDFRGRPTTMVPINPDRVWIYEAPGGELFYSVMRRGLHETAVLKDLPLLIAADDMLHIRWLSTDNSLWGTSRIAMAREALGLALAQQQLAARMTANGTNLGGYLASDNKLSDEAFERLKKQVGDNFQGLANAGKTAILEEGLKYQKLGMSSVDAEFLNSRKFSVEEIARLFRVPLYKLSVAEGRATGSSMVQMDQEYLNSVLLSWCERISAKMEQCFDIGGEMFIAHDYDAFLRADIMTRLQAKRLGITSGQYTPNEARRGEGLPDMTGGDQLFMPANLLPIHLVGKVPSGAGPGSDTSGVPADGGDGDPSAPPPDAAPGI